MLKLILLVASAAIFLILVILVFLFRRKFRKTEQRDVEKSPKAAAATAEEEELITFEGGEDLTIDEILEAPGEVIGKSKYGTLYKASLQKSQRTRVLRFLRPAAAAVDSCDGAVGFLGSIRHRNLVPMLGFYAGRRGEKLLVHPFFGRGNLADSIRVGEAELQKWEIIYKIAIGVAEALDHLHNGLQKPVAHGNLKSNNILLDRNFEPHVSDFGLHLLLNPAANQDLLRVSADFGYKAPELIKMTAAGERTDVYSYGKILQEILPNHGGDSDERILRCFRIAEDCCSSSPDLRPDFKEVIAKIEEIGRTQMD